jgi:hypothetical protein
MWLSDAAAHSRAHVSIPVGVGFGASRDAETARAVSPRGHDDRLVIDQLIENRPHEEGDPR